MTTSMRLIVCTFDAEERADEVSQTLQELDRQLHTVKLGNVAIIQRTPDGEIAFHETHDLRARISQIASTVVGGATWFLYAFAGQLGPIAGAVASEETDMAINRFVRDASFPDDALTQIGQQLDAGSSALVTVVHAEQAPIVIAEIERLGGTLSEHTLPPEVAARILGSSYP